jgi:dihydroorotate dehydrogenase
MSLVPYALTRPFLFGLDPERAHDLTMDSIARLQNTPAQCLWAGPRVDDPVTLAGLRFANRWAWPRGWTRTAAASTAWGRWASASSRWAPSRPRAAGNPKPRMFRLPAAHALINRLGFNNEGLDSFVANVQRATATALAAASWA